MLRQPHPVSQSSGYSKLASADAAHCDAELLNLQDRRLLPQYFAELQKLSGKPFTLDAAACDSGNNAHCAAFCSPSRSFLGKLHTGHLWINAPFTMLLEFAQHYMQCKQAAPSTSACIVVPGFLLPVMRPFLKGMHILKTYRKGSVLFDAPTLSGQRRAMTGVHWPVYVFTDAVPPTHVPANAAGQKCHPLHNAVVHQPSDVPSVPAKVSSQPLTMLFEGLLNWQDSSVLLDSGASANFISQKALEKSKHLLHPTDATLELADGHTSKILGTATVNLRIGGFRSHVSCFVTNLGTNFDIILGNTFLTDYKAVLNYHLGTCSLTHHAKSYTLRPLSYSGANSSSPCIDTVRPVAAPVASAAKVPVEQSILTVAKCKRALRQGCENFLVMVNTSTASSLGVSLGTATVTSVTDSTSPPCAASSSSLSQQLDSIKTDFADVFAEPSGLPPDRGIEHVIPLDPGAQPPFKRMYRLSPSELQEVKRQVTELLQKQLIEPSVSPFGAPILFVLKKGGDLRMVIDYRALNKLTVKNRYPLPRIDDLFDKLQGSQYFTSLDAASGFHQILLQEYDVTLQDYHQPASEVELISSRLHAYN